MADRAAIWNLPLIYRLPHLPDRFDEAVRGTVRALAGVPRVAVAPSPDASARLAFSPPAAPAVGAAVAANQCLREVVDAHNATRWA